MESLECLCERFLGHCGAKGLSDHSVRAYQSDLAAYVLWSQKHSIDASFKKDTILAWIRHLREADLAPASIKRRIATLKVFCRWLEDEEILQDNPFLRLKSLIRLPKRLPRNLTAVELAALLNSPPASSDRLKSETLALALELLFTTGVRIGELCAIEMSAIDHDAGTIKIHGKGNRERLVFLVDENSKRQVRSYIALRNGRASATSKLLIRSNGQPATPDYIRKLLHHHVDHLNLSRRITPHMLRHSAATQLLENGVDIRFVQKLLGHASISTTEIYTHVSDTSLQEAIRTANPRRKVSDN